MKVHHIKNDFLLVLRRRFPLFHHRFNLEIQPNQFTMLAQITEGVKVTVQTEYQQDYSVPEQGHFVFTYKINIENNSPFTIQLLTRHWEIFDILGANREVDGDGVVGQQPVLEPGESHEYVSGCNLKSGVGKMNGSYEMERIVDGSRFLVQIPEFTMIVPWQLN
jgi:ApaG protein